MRIYGFFKKGPLEAAYVVSTVTLKDLNVAHRVEFLVDTGASRTIISDRDALRLGVDYKKLLRAGLSLGIGGRVDTYASKNVDLVFLTADMEQYVERVEELYFLKHRRVDEDILKIPSVLGRDILNKYLLIYDKRRERVVITDEEAP